MKKDDYEDLDEIKEEVKVKEEKEEDISLRDYFPSKEDTLASYNDDMSKRAVGSLYSTFKESKNGNSNSKEEKREEKDEIKVERAERVQKREVSSDKVTENTVNTVNVKISKEIEDTKSSADQLKEATAHRKRKREEYIENYKTVRPAGGVSTNTKQKMSAKRKNAVIFRVGCLSLIILLLLFLLVNSFKIRSLNAKIDQLTIESGKKSEEISVLNNEKTQLTTQVKNLENTLNEMAIAEAESEGEVDSENIDGNIDETSETNSNTNSTQNTYTIKVGDTLWGIARQFYSDPASGIDKICAANGIAKSSPLSVGKELLIP